MENTQNTLAAIDESARRRFESAWQAGRPEPIDGFVPPPDNPLHLATLEELVHIELEFAWKQPREPASGLASRAPVESYLQRFPQLNRPAIVLRLLKQEWRVRADAGAEPTSAEFRARFPQWLGPDD